MIIDSDNYEASGIEVLRFPGGEFHAKIGKRYPEVPAHIFAKIRTWDDFGKFLVVADAFKRQSVPVYCFMPYLPGARQDRAQDGTALTSAIYASAIRGVVDHLTYVDPHSNAAEQIFSFGTAYRTSMPFNFVTSLVTERPDVILAPDKGATHRAGVVANLLDPEIPVYFCTKKRDFNTGKLLGFDLPAEIPSGKVLIVDDICDGGGTFLGIGSSLLERRDGHHLSLYVTHGIFSQGLDRLMDVFHNIYTTNSWNQQTHERLKVHDLIPNYIGGLRP